MARRQIRRETEIFSISFLDCITCGLGSVVLLLVLSNIRTPEMDQEDEDIEAQIVKLEDELIDIASQSEILNRDLKAQQEQLSDEKQRIARLQGDLSDIREYTTPQMFAEISMQINERGGEPQRTEVIAINADLLEVVTENDTAIASVRFNGQLREAPASAPEQFDEIWHVQKDLKDPEAVWLLAGIQQVS